nr:Ferrous-iron efflux pump FieF [Klebsiella pneumoniae]
MGYEAVQSLLDRALPDEERQDIITIVTAWPGIRGAHDLRTRQSGPTRFIQIHLEMEDNLPLVQAHVIADRWSRLFCAVSGVRCHYPSGSQLCGASGAAGLLSVRL